MKRTGMHVITILLLALLLAACASAQPSAPLAPSAPSAQAPVPQTGNNGEEVNISNFAFNPSSLTISMGNTVKWTNQDQDDHTVTADDKSFDSGQLSKGKTFSFTFTQEGTFTYKCTNHPFMVGTIIVSK